MKKISKKEQIFINLLEGCYRHNTYSLSGICSKMGIPYEQIKEWAKENDEWSSILETCLMLCESNAEIAAIMKRIPVQEAIKYFEENE